MSTVRTRIAPSPTGDPHVGTAYMGLVNMIHAHQSGGQFILRIDDTDRNRYRHGSEEAIFASLRWLGLEWDEGPDKGGPVGPYRQSERTEIYREHARMLVERGSAYRCFCSKERIDALRAEQIAKKENPGYDRLCRTLNPEDAARRAAQGEPHVIRLAVPLEGATQVRDLLRGDMEPWANTALQDQILLKEDGFPTYHLASVVDDHLFGITHIIRAEEWISSAPLHQLLFGAFGWEMPVICHMPLLRNADKSKISKRKNPTSLLYYRDAGFLPEGLLNFLGLMGWGGPKLPDGTNQEIFSLPEMQAHFRLEDIRVGGPVFDMDKLHHVNACHLRALPPADYLRRVEAYLFSAERMLRIAELAQPRTQTLGEFMGVTDFFFGDVSHVHPEDRKKKDQRRPIDGLIPAGKTAEEAWFALADVLQALEKVEPWSAAALEAACRDLSDPEAVGWKTRELFMTLRVAITGKAETPPLFETMELLGKPRCLGRLGDALRVLPEPSKKAQARREKERRAKGPTEAEASTG